MITNQLFYYLNYLLVLVAFLYATRTYAQVLTSEDSRKNYRLRVVKELNKQKSNIEMKQSNLAFSKKFYAIGLRSFNVIYYQAIRIGLLLLIGYLYGYEPYLEGNGVNIIFIFIMLYLIYGTSVKERKYSIVHFILNDLLKTKQKKKETELMNLFAMIQSELETNEGKEVNSYHMLDGLLGYFEHIHYAMRQYMRLHKESPQLARDAFAKEIGGDQAEIFANFLHQLNESTREDALKAIEKNAELYSVFSIEKSAQQNTKKDIFFSSIFLVVSMVSVAWMILLVTSVVLNQI